MKKFKNLCKEAVKKIMVKSNKDTTSFVDLADIVIYGVIAFAVLLSIAALTFFVFNMTAISIGIVLYAIFDAIVVNIGCDGLGKDILDEYDEIIKNIEGDIEEMKKEVF